MALSELYLLKTAAVYGYDTDFLHGDECFRKNQPLKDCVLLLRLTESTFLTLSPARFSIRQEI